jgi:hypothetical protein
MCIGGSLQHNESYKNGQQKYPFKGQVLESILIGLFMLHGAPKHRALCVSHIPCTIFNKKFLNECLTPKHQWRTKCHFIVLDRLLRMQ